MSAGSAPAAEPVTHQGDAPDTGVEPGSQSVEAQTQDDPEIELDAGVKLKRSELRDLHKRRKELDKGAFDKFQEAAKLRKEAAEERAQAQQLVQAMGKDYKAALRAAGHDPVKVAEQILKEALDEYQLSPQDRELRDYKAKVEEYERQQAELAEQQKAAQEQAAVQQWEQRFDQAFTGAIQTVGLPKTARVVARMAEKVESYWGAGVEVPLEEIAAEIKQDIIAERRELLQSIKDEQAADLYDDSELEIARKLILRKAQASAPKQPVQSQTKAPPKPKNGLTRAELSARLDARTRS